jgi:hypothetical protein
MLLEELIKFNDDGNFDRIIAASLALALARHMDPQITVSTTAEDPRTKALYSRKKGSRIFTPGSSRGIWTPQKSRSL